MLWRNENELKPDDSRLGSISKFEFCSVRCEEDEAEFSMINSDLLDLHLEDIDSVTHLLFQE